MPRVIRTINSEVPVDLLSQNWHEALKKASYNGYDITLLTTALEGKGHESLNFDKARGRILCDGKPLVDLFEIIKLSNDKKISPEHLVKDNQEYNEDKKVKRLADILTKTISHKLNSLPEIKAIPETIAYNGENFDEDLNAFAAHCTSLPKEQLNIKMVKPGLTSGATGVPVFLVFNKSNDTLMCVIKAHDYGSAQREINAFILLESMSFNNVQFPSLLGIATSGTGDTTTTMVAQTSAPGQSLVDEMKEASQTLKFDSLREGISKAALGIAEFHEKKSTSMQDINTIERKNLIDSFKNDLSNYFYFLKEKSIVNPEKLEILEEKLKAVEFSSTGNLVHHDFHPGNVFFDGKKITIIDNDGVSKSPNGIGSFDTIYFYHWIAIQGMISGIQIPEIEILQDLFLSEYIKHSNNKNVLEELRFMNVYIPAKYIRDLTIVLTLPNHSWLNSFGEKTIEKLIIYLSINLVKIAE